MLWLTTMMWTCPSPSGPQQIHPQKMLRMVWPRSGLHWVYKICRPPSWYWLSVPCPFVSRLNNVFNLSNHWINQRWEVELPSITSCKKEALVIFCTPSVSQLSFRHNLAKWSSLCDNVNLTVWDNGVFDCETYLNPQLDILIMIVSQQLF